jgi:hypothetical protein
MCGPMSPTFCKRIRVTARSRARTGHVAVLGSRGVGEGRGPCDLSKPLFDSSASGRRSGGGGRELSPHLGGAPRIGVSVKTATTIVVEPLYNYDTVLESR